MTSENFLNPVQNIALTKKFLNTLEPDEINKLIDIQALASLNRANARTRAHESAITKAQAILKNEQSVKKFINSTKGALTRPIARVKPKKENSEKKIPWSVVNADGSLVTRLQFIEVII